MNKAATQKTETTIHSSGFMDYISDYMSCYLADGDTMETKTDIETVFDFAHDSLYHSDMCVRENEQDIIDLYDEMLKCVLDGYEIGEFGEILERY